MSTSALIIKRNVESADAAAAMARKDAARYGARIIFNHTNGTLISGEADKLASLEKEGYRVFVYENTHLLKVGDWVIDIETETPQIMRSLSVPSKYRKTWPHHLVQLAGPPTTEWIREIEEQNIEVIGRISDYALFVCGDPTSVSSLKELPYVAWTGFFEPAYRIDAELEKQTGTIRNVCIGVYPYEATDEVIEALTSCKAKILNVVEPNQSYHAQPAWITVEIQNRRLPIIARMPHVTRLEYAPPKEYYGERETQILAENLNNTPSPNTGPVTGYQNFLNNTIGVDGTAVTIAICDSGVDTGPNMNANGHLDLRGRQSAFVDYSGGLTNDVVGHGTHVAGIAAGNAATGLTEAVAPANFLWGQGTAPNVQYVNQQMGGAPVQPAGGYGVLTQDAVNNGATIQNNSWGGPSAGYNADCVTYDQLVRDPDQNTAVLENLCIVFAAGNNGGFPQTVGNPSEAKNVITVGNSLSARPGVGALGDDIRGINGNSGRGPTPDNRIKPDVVAPGTDVSSMYTPTNILTLPIAGVGTPDPANPGSLINQYTYMSGTSMAAPHVTGCCALLTEWWRGRTNGRNPSPAMLKALLINGAEDLGIAPAGQNWKEVTGTRFNPAGVANVYQCNNMGYVPQQVLDTQQTMVQRNSLVAINANGQWFYDNINDILYVRRFNGAAPLFRSIWALDANPVGRIPNNDQGWGRVSLPNIILQSPASDRGPKVFSDQRHAFTANGQEVMFRVAPVDVNRPMRITITWTDAPANAGANPALRNNLNLEVTEVATGNVYRGNVFNNGFSVIGGAFDSLNNVECVFIQNVNQNSTYEIRVLANSITGNAKPPFDNTSWQDFALVADNAEYAEADPVSVSVVLDRSSSMVTSNYVDVTRTSSKQFIDLMGIDDHLGVVSFGTTGHYEYPNGGGTAPQITGQQIKTDAKTAVDNVNFSGCTYMGDGIDMGHGLLQGLAGNKAMVLLSDGYDNKGCDENNPAKSWAIDVATALPAGIPIYSCAMGPQSDQTLLDNIAQVTDGRYYYMPTIDDLYEIYNYIRGQVTDTGVIVNDSNVASFSRVSGTVDCGAKRVTFSVAWGNPAIKYVNHSAEKDHEISVRLRNPYGRLLPADSAYIRRIIGDGYVVFIIDEPVAGKWYVEVQTKRGEHTRYTVGGFVDSSIKMVLKTLPKPVYGRPFYVQAEVYDGKTPISDIRAVAELTQPAFTIKDLLKRYDLLLSEIKPDINLIKDGVPESIAKLLTLRNMFLKNGEKDIFYYEKKKHRFVPLKDEVIKYGPRSGSAQMPEVLGKPSVTRETVVSQNVLTPARLADLAQTTQSLSQQLGNLSVALGQSSSLMLPIKYDKSGSYNIHVVAYGNTSAKGCRFVRKDMVSVVLPEE